MTLMKVTRRASWRVLKALVLLFPVIHAQAESTHLEVASFPKINMPTWVVRTTAYRNDAKSKWQPGSISIYQSDKQPAGPKLSATALIAEANHRKYFLGLAGAWKIRRENIGNAAGMMKQCSALAEAARKSNVKEMRKELGFLPEPPSQKSRDPSDNTIAEITGDTLYFDVRNEQGVTKYSLLIGRANGDENGDRLSLDDVSTILELFGKLPVLETQFAPLPAAPPETLTKDKPASVEAQFVSGQAAAGGWTGYGTGKSPWAVEARKCEDGEIAPFRSSLPNGETLTGTLRSALFAAPEKLQFFLSGHDGKKNIVRLVDATGKVLREAGPPGSDVAHRVLWNLTEIRGRSVRFEATDGSDGTGYAWIAFGRFKPELPQLALAPAKGAPFPPKSKSTPSK